MDQDLSITTTLFISPSPSPTSPLLLPLSHIDNDRNLRLTFRTLRLYSPPPSDSDPFKTFAGALSKALSLYYPLAGTLLIDSGRLVVRCSAGDTVPLTYATSPLPLGSFQTEPGSDFLNRMAPDLDSGRELAYPLALQLTRFACGGLALGMCVHHALCDGAGATKFLSAVARFARGEDQAGFLPEPIWDRARLLGPRSPACVEVDFGEFLSFDEGNWVYVGNEEGVVLRECFHVNEVCLNRFRNRLREECGSSFTAFEALGAFIWRARFVQFLFCYIVEKIVKIMKLIQ